MTPSRVLVYLNNLCGNTIERLYNHAQEQQGKRHFALIYTFGIFTTHIRSKNTYRQLRTANNCLPP